MTPAERLQAVIRALPRPAQEALTFVVDRRLLKRAYLGQAVNASAHLQLCAAAGFDPVTGDAIAPQSIGALHYPSLSVALRMRRIEQKLSIRKAAKEGNLKPSTIERIEAGEAVSITAILEACRYLGRHPFDFAAPSVCRETSTAARRVA